MKKNKEGYGSNPYIKKKDIDHIFTDEEEVKKVKRERKGVSFNKLKKRKKK